MLDLRGNEDGQFEIEAIVIGRRDALLNNRLYFIFNHDATTTTWVRRLDNILGGMGSSPKVHSIARLRKLYEWLKQGPLTIYGELEYELCVCRSGRTEFQRQTPIEDNEEVFDGSDRIEVSRARSTLIKRMIKDMYRKLK